jgi:glutamate 5-kinase
MRAALDKLRRVVVKIGTSLLAPPDGGVHARRFSELAQDVCCLLDSGREVVMVSSGAVGLGVRRLGLEGRPRAIPEKQAAAAIGQIDLCRRFERAFARRGRIIGQILLTHGGLAERELFLNARHTLNTLLARGAVPVINENDSVATEELRFGDNDQLAAQVVNLCGAELLVLLTDIDGLHDRDPREPGARPIRELAEVQPVHLELAGGSSSALGSGGMRSKLEAARSAARYGAFSVIADGRRRGVLARVLAGEELGTLVHPAREQISSRKHWIAFSLKPRGTLQLDAGAVRALVEKGASLLPAGVVGVEGEFGIGDPVRCVGPDGREVARGLISYAAADTRVIMGQRSSRISTLLGYSSGAWVIHRDDLIVL